MSKIQWVSRLKSNLNSKSILICKSVEVAVLNKYFFKKLQTARIDLPNNNLIWSQSKWVSIFFLYMKRKPQYLLFVVFGKLLLRLRLSVLEEQKKFKL